MRLYAERKEEKGGKMRYREPFTFIKRGKYWYYAIYINDKRVYKTTGQKTKARAMEYVLARIDERQESVSTKKNGGALTFSEFARPWWMRDTCLFLRYKEKLGKVYSGKYIDNCRMMMENHLLPAFGKIKMRDIRAMEIQEWMFALADSGLAHKTINNSFTTLSVMMKEAVRRELISKNPCDGVDRLVGSDSKERGRLSSDEAKSLFSSLDNWNGNRMKYTANLLASVTGMRSREVAALRGQDIRDGYIVVEHSFDERYGLKCTKTGDRRELPVPPLVLDLLNTLKRGDDDWLFSLDGVKPVSQHFFLYGLYEALEKIGIDKAERKRRNITFHSWRHFLNSVLLANGASKIMTQRITGHTTDEMTEHYAHFTVDDYKPVLDVMSSLLPSG